jgi:type IV pilus assembly protein PilN
MIRINLLPFRAARRKENIRRQISIFLLSFIFSFIALFYYQMQLDHQLGELKTKADDLKNTLKIFRKKSREVDNIKKALDTLKEKINVIKTLELNRRGPVRLMEAMTGMVIHKRMWFTDFSINNDAVVIKGNALDNKTVADFMTQLEQSGFFSTVNLTTLKQVTIQKVNVKGFEISCEKIPLKAIGEDKGKN